MNVSVLVEISKRVLTSSSPPTAAPGLALSAHGLKKKLC